MSILATLQTDKTIEAEKDTLGGGGFIIPSQAVELVIDTAYIDQSKNGAYSLNLTFKDSPLRSTIYMTNRKGENFYVRDGKKNYLPGFSLANALCLLTVGKELSTLEAEEKVLNVWNSELGKVAPTTKPVIMELLGETIIAGVLQRVENKSKFNQARNEYEPTNDKREFNEIVKFFQASSGLTVAEITAESKEAVFLEQWKDKWDGVVDDRYKEVASTPVTSGTPVGGKSLFPKKG